MAATNDWLGGYTLQELLGAAPVTKSPKQIKKDNKAAQKAVGKRGVVATVVGAPFRLVVRHYQAANQRRDQTRERCTSCDD